MKDLNRLTGSRFLIGFASMTLGLGIIGILVMFDIINLDDELLSFGITCLTVLLIIIIQILVDWKRK